MRYVEAWHGVYDDIAELSSYQRTKIISLKDVEDLLNDESFCRSHQSHIINLDHLRKFKKGDGGSIEMGDGTILPVSRSKKGEFTDRILKIRK